MRAAHERAAHEKAAHENMPTEDAFVVLPVIV
jgi:hypothetical protein